MSFGDDTLDPRNEEEWRQKRELTALRDVAEAACDYAGQLTQWECADDYVPNEWERRIMDKCEALVGLAKAQEDHLEAIQAGDSLGNGLWAAPEEPTVEMWDAYWKYLAEMEPYLRDKLSIHDFRTIGWGIVKAMRRAAGGETLKPSPVPKFGEDNGRD